VSDGNRVTWRVHVVAKDEAKARRVAARAHERLGRELHVEHVERYWKLPEQQVIDAWTPLTTTAFAEAVVETLQLAGRLAHRSSAGTPWAEPDGRWSFDGIGTDFTVAGIAFLTWTLERGGEAVPESSQAS
jgi:hypothetical protein